MTARQGAALDGITVLDFSTLLPGPLAGLILAEAGARVIKIERPGGEDMRRYPPFVDGRSVLHESLNRGKEIVELDLKTAAGVAQAQRMAASADILIEQFRPGVMARLGLGSEVLRADNPRLITCSISGYGQNGPDAQRAGHDLNYMGDTGVLALSSAALPPALLADIGGGSFPAVMNILLALYRRERTGKGAAIDIAMTDNLFVFAWWAYASGTQAGLWPGDGDGPFTGCSPRYRLYPARDGALVAVAALEDKFWAALCETVGLPVELRDDQADPVATADGLAARLQTMTGAQWAPLLSKADCCTTIVRSLQDAVQHPHFVARGLFNPNGALPVPVVPELRF
ncbi:MAG: CaiB/BaiF CoA-transferase family protein [Pseudomonadota bacterium]